MNASLAKPSAQHATFVIERSVSQPPARVYAAWADPSAKARRFAAPADQCKTLLREMDFRVGGRERLRGAWNRGVVSDLQAHDHDMVPGRRIVYSYAMHLDERRISVSLATIEFEPQGACTRLKLTEQSAFLDGYDDAGSRERGTGALLDNLAHFLTKR